MRPEADNSEQSSFQRNQVSEHGIERLKFAYCSMDDSVPVHCNDALKYLPHFKDLISIDLDRSDATDEGLAYAKGMPHLLSVSAFASDISGASFKTLQSCPKLASIEPDHCKLDRKTLKDLIPMKSLVSLGQCASLTSLDIGTNKRITDAGMPALKNLHKLTRLELKDTKVTLDGMKPLQSLPLKEISVATEFKSAEELGRFRKMFPGVKIVNTWKHVVSDDDKTLFAPLR